MIFSSILAAATLAATPVATENVQTGQELRCERSKLYLAEAVKQVAEAQEVVIEMRELLGSDDPRLKQFEDHVASTIEQRRFMSSFKTVACNESLLAWGREKAKEQ